MHRQTPTLPRAFLAALAIVVAIGLGGCAAFSGSVLRETRGTLNETAAQTNAEQMLRNIVRLRYGDTPYFLEVSSVSTSATVSANVGASAAVPLGLDPTFAASTGVGLSQTPSFVFQPLAGEKFAKQLLRPLDLRTLALLRAAGFGLREILLVFADAINGVANAPAATLYAPREIPDGSSFRRVADLVERLEGGAGLHAPGLGGRHGLLPRQRLRLLRPRGVHRLPDLLGLLVADERSGGHLLEVRAGELRPLAAVEHEVADRPVGHDAGHGPQVGRHALGGLEQCGPRLGLASQQVLAIVGGHHRVLGKPRSTLDVPGSGQRSVTTLPRV